MISERLEIRTKMVWDRYEIQMRRRWSRSKWTSERVETRVRWSQNELRWGSLQMKLKWSQGGPKWGHYLRVSEDESEVIGWWDNLEASFPHLQPSVFEVSLTWKFRFHIFNLQFLGEISRKSLTVSFQLKILTSCIFHLLDHQLLSLPSLQLAQYVLFTSFLHLSYIFLHTSYTVWLHLSNLLLYPLGPSFR